MPDTISFKACTYNGSSELVVSSPFDSLYGTIITRGIPESVNYSMVSSTERYAHFKFDELYKLPIDSFYFYYVWENEFASDTQFVLFYLDHFNNIPQPIYPDNNSNWYDEEIPFFSWEGHKDSSYLFELSLDSTFHSVYYDELVMDTMVNYGYPLIKDYQFYWRVTGFGRCGYQRSEIFTLRNLLTSKIHNLEGLGFKVFPNPVNEDLHISLNGKPINGIVSIIDLTGKIVMSQPYLSSIDVSDLLNGIYIVNVKSEDYNWVGKIIKK